MQMRCIHCLKISDKTKDHALPKHWYPEDTPSTVQRRTAPSCYECNNKIGKAEEWIFILLALCTNPNQAEAQGIHAKLREKLGIGINPRLLHGEAMKNWECKDNLRKKILQLVSPYNPNLPHFPNLGPDPAFLMREHMTVPVPDHELRMVSEKIIRGLEYIFDKRYIEPTHEVSVYFPEATPDVVRDVDAILAVVPHNYGPGFVVKRRVSNSKFGGALYKIKVWGKLEIYGCIVERETM